MITETRQVSIVLNGCKSYIGSITEDCGHPPGTILTASVTIKAKLQTDIEAGFRGEAAEMIESCFTIHYAPPKE